MVRRASRTLLDPVGDGAPAGQEPVRDARIEAADDDRGGAIRVRTVVIRVGDAVPVGVRRPWNENGGPRARALGKVPVLVNGDAPFGIDAGRPSPPESRRCHIDQAGVLGPEKGPDVPEVIVRRTTGIRVTATPGPVMSNPGTYFPVGKGRSSSAISPAPPAATVTFTVQLTVRTEQAASFAQ
jgi:hypothetical protein